MGRRHAQYPLFVLVSILVAASVAVAHEGDAPPVKIGGAIGVNLFYGDFDDARGEGVGVAGFDLFRFNADLDYQNDTCMFEYRWFESYSMLHTARSSLTPAVSGASARQRLRQNRLAATANW